MKIGIGITSYKRPEHLQLCIDQISRHTHIDAKIHATIDTDEDRKGVAFRKNECLMQLKDCDYIFLFDDDCFPIADGWVDYFIQAHKESGQHHFLYLKETSTIKSISKENGIIRYNNCGGVFIFLTKQVIETVGGFCKDYGFYGYEHAGYSKRIHLSGLNSMGEYLSPEHSGEFIYAMDYDYDMPFNKQVNHRPSMINEVSKLQKYVKSNYEVYKKDIQTINQPL